MEDSISEVRHPINFMFWENSEKKLLTPFDFCQYKARGEKSGTQKII